MKYAIIKNKEVGEILQNRPREIEFNSEMVYFDDDTTDIEFANYGILPYTERGEPSTEPYFTNDFRYEITDKVTGIWTNRFATIEMIRKYKTDEVNAKWDKAITEGSMLSPSLNTTIDVRRNGVNNDVQNLVEIINLCEMNRSLLPFPWRCSDNSTKYLSLDDLKLLRAEMSGYAIEMYNRKFIALDQIKSSNLPHEAIGVEF